MNLPPADPGANPSFRGVMVVLGVWSLLLVLCTAGAVVAVKKRYADARRGWNLVPVVVVSREVPEGATLTIEDISQRSMPEQFVTASVVLPDEASRAVHRTVRSTLLAGDPLLWRDLGPEVP